MVFESPSPDGIFRWHLVGVTCIPETHPLGILNFSFDSEQNLNSLFSLCRSEHQKSALRPAGTLSKNLLATFRYVKSIWIHPVFQVSGTCVSELFGFSQQNCGQIQHVCRQQEAPQEQNHQIEAQLDLRRDSAIRGSNFLHRTLLRRPPRKSVETLPNSVHAEN